MAMAGALAFAAGLVGELRAESFAGQYRPAAEPVADGVWIVRGADEPIAFSNGGAIANSTLIATDAGTILVDPGPSFAYARALADLAKATTGGAITRVYVTHLHPDHSLGAAYFDPAIVHALRATHDGVERDGAGFSDGMYRILADWMAGTAVVPPQGDVMPGPIEWGGRTLHLHAFSGHSAGDLVLLDDRTRTLIAGDLVFHDRAPATPHADLGEWQAALGKLREIPHDRLIPGHGPLDTDGAAIAQTSDWLSWLDGVLREAVAGGLDMSEAGALDIPPRFAAMKAARYEMQRSISHFYPRLEAELLAPVGGK